MSRIDDLIAEQCPGGVEHVPLSDVAEYSGSRISASNLDSTTFVGVDNLVADKGGRVDASYPPNSARLARFEPGDILLGNIRPYLKKVWLATRTGGCSGDVLAIAIKADVRERLSPEFLYYVLSSDKFFSYDMQHAKGAKMPRGDKAAIMGYRIPVPPLEIQCEIVRILDGFTSLEAELEAELEARRAQYTHYRSSVFRDLDRRHCSLVSLADLGKWYGGGTPSKARPEYWNTGEIPWVSPKDMGRSVLSSTMDHITSTAVSSSATKLVPGGSVAIVARSSILNHTLPVAYVPMPVALNQDMKALVVREGILAKFVYYALEAHAEEILLKVRRMGGSVASLDSSRLRSFQIPIPQIEDQEQIVELLDKFDALVNDLTSGLPAELEARRRQYEYYRDELLTFKELV